MQKTTNTLSIATTCLNLHVLCNEIKSIVFHVFVCSEKTLALCHFYFFHMRLNVSTWTTSMTSK